MRLLGLLTALVASAPLCAQWRLQDSQTGADLRGIHYAGNGVAWASGTNGTILRTGDMGRTWRHCSIPPGAEHLDFRAIQAFDGTTAIAMSSGAGALSRVYKTTDACHNWKLVFTNPDVEGFFDALSINASHAFGYVLGDPVHPGGRNARMGYNDGAPYLESARFFDLPLAHGTSSSGAFAVAICCDAGDRYPKTIVVVGGDYKLPNATGSSVTLKHIETPLSRTVARSKTAPHGYRSAVAYDKRTKTWFTVGPNGTDISTDDGLNWRPLKPAPGDPTDADQHWNAVSLPFVVGPHGRIGLLKDGHRARKSQAETPALQFRRQERPEARYR